MNNETSLGLFSAIKSKWLATVAMCLAALALTLVAASTAFADADYRYLFSDIDDTGKVVFTDDINKCSFTFELTGGVKEVNVDSLEKDGSPTGYYLVRKIGAYNDKTGKAKIIDAYIMNKKAEKVYDLAFKNANTDTFQESNIDTNSNVFIMGVRNGSSVSDYSSCVVFNVAKKKFIRLSNCNFNHSQGKYDAKTGIPSTPKYLCVFMKSAHKVKIYDTNLKLIATISVDKKATQVNMVEADEWNGFRLELLSKSGKLIANKYYSAAGKAIVKTFGQLEVVKSNLKYSDFGTPVVDISKTTKVKNVKYLDKKSKRYLKVLANGFVVVKKSAPVGTYKFKATFTGKGVSNYTREIKVKVTNKYSSKIYVYYHDDFVDYASLKKKTYTYNIGARVESAGFYGDGNNINSNLTYSVAKYDDKSKKKYFGVSKTGKVTIIKGAPRGEYKMTVAVKYAGTNNVSGSTVNVPVTINVY